MQLEDLAQLVQRQHQETRRHFDVSTEALRNEVQIVAEGVLRLADRLGKVESSVEGLQE